MTVFSVGRLGLAVFGIAAMSVAQVKTPAPVVPAPVQPVAGVAYRSGASLDELAKELMQGSRVAPSGNVSVTLEKFPTHFTMVSTRVKSGGAELHKKYADIFIATDGEATVVTGGTIVDLKDTGDEVRGTRLEGGVPQVMHKGDVITIAANVPHQTLVAEGKTFTYFVVKVLAP